ncbi:hypothetical protein BDV93DRAFT_259139 [Ceratobasidium sp. AG-I]|nr:hypothetical protein BDV93DRAFT_259139 [Ceratobasidium sp. AG-I]
MPAQRRNAYVWVHESKIWPPLSRKRPRDPIRKRGTPTAPDWTQKPGWSQYKTITVRNGQGDPWTGGNHRETMQNTTKSAVPSTRLTPSTATNKKQSPRKSSAKTLGRSYDYWWET